MVGIQDAVLMHAMTLAVAAVFVQLAVFMMVQ